MKAENSGLPEIEIAAVLNLRILTDLQISGGGNTLIKKVPHTEIKFLTVNTNYEVASVSRIDVILGHFCKRFL